jgi:hypothetical protein
VTNANWPLVVDNVAFVGDPNDPNATPTYTDLTARVRSFEASRGRQYEIDQNQTGEAHLVVSDKDENLNPANTGAPAPFAGNIKPYRRYLRQAMWPPTPVGAAVNVCGTGAGYDPDFETTAVGATPPFLLTFNNSPTVQAANPQFGTKSLQWAVTGGSPGPEQVAGFTVTTIPGQQYTASVYYRQTVANTGVLFVNGGASSSTTTTTGSYVRLTVTFTATQPSHQLFVGSIAPTLAGTVNIDGFQVEPGASASTFATTGPVIYTPFAGYVERWPSNWNHQGLYGMAALACVDSMATLAGTDMHTEYRSALLTKQPTYYWPLSESTGATTFAEASGNGGLPLVRTDAQAGPATSFGNGATNIPGDASGSGLAIVDTASVGSWLQTNVPGFTAAATAAPWSLSVSFWFIVASPTTNNFLFSIFNYSWLNKATAVYILQSTSTRTEMGLGPSDGGLDFIDFNTTTLYDGKPHHIVATVNMVSTTSLTYTFWVDGVQQMTRTINPTTTWPGSPLNFSSTQINVGAYMDPYVVTWPQINGESGTYAHAAIWNRVLSNGEISDLWNAGKGYPGETSGARITRYLSIGGYTGPSAVDTGQSVMGPGTVTEGAALLDACQQVALSENGNFYVEGGSVIFHSRTDRYLKTTAKWVFGENQAGGEYPYETDIAFDFDPTRVVNDVKVSRVGGIATEVTDAASQKSYFRRTYQRTIGVQSDNETIDAANYLLNKFKQPIQRVSVLTLKPSANPALWPAALGVRIGDRVTVTRRTTVFTQSADFFIEKVMHNNQPGEWTTTFQMSPVDRTTVWILGDATYGQLGITTVPGY